MNPDTRICPNIFGNFQFRDIHPLHGIFDITWDSRQLPQISKEIVIISVRLYDTWLYSSNLQVKSYTLAAPTVGLCMLVRGFMTALKPDNTTVYLHRSKASPSLFAFQKYVHIISTNLSNHVQVFHETTNELYDYDISKSFLLLLRMIWFKGVLQFL